MNITLKIWRQKNRQAKGEFKTYHLDDLSPDMSILEMLDVLNDKLTREGQEPVEYDNDCREGICGSCGMVINGVSHGKMHRAATCQLHMRHFKDGETVTVEPFRARGFPVIKDLVVDRSAFERIIAAGGYVAVNTGAPQDANAIPISKEDSDEAMDAAECIGCGACVAACPNASASLFTSAKIAQFVKLPQGHPERARRVRRMVDQMDKEGFGNCSNHGECEAACPKGIPIAFIAQMKREYIRAMLEQHVTKE